MNIHSCKKIFQKGIEEPFVQGRTGVETCQEGQSVETVRVQSPNPSKGPSEPKRNH